jgi:hypothetical protein
VEEAQKIQAFLKAAGIDSSVDTKSGGSVVTGAVVFGIYVEDQDAPEAASLMADWIGKHLDPEEPDWPAREDDEPSP